LTVQYYIGFVLVSGGKVMKLQWIGYDNMVPNWRRSKFVSNQYIIVMVVYGQVMYEIDEVSLALSKGDILITYPGVTRFGTNGPYPPHRKYSAHFTLDPSQQELLNELPVIKGYQHFKSRKFDYYHQRFTSMHRQWMGSSPLREFACQGMVMELFSSMLTGLQEQNIPAHKQLIVSELEAYILAHFNEDIRISQLAELVKLSPNYVTTIFKEVTGQSPIDYVHHHRVSVASDLLLHSDMNIRDISDYLGFCEPAYFNRIFKKVTGVPPSALQKQHE
jgi:AraC-like DNA-binding protein